MLSSRLVEREELPPDILGALDRMREAHARGDFEVAKDGVTKVRFPGGGLWLPKANQAGMTVLERLVPFAFLATFLAGVGTALGFANGAGFRWTLLWCFLGGAAVSALVLWLRNREERAAVSTLEVGAFLLPDAYVVVVGSKYQVVPRAAVTDVVEVRQRRDDDGGEDRRQLMLVYRTPDGHEARCRSGFVSNAAARRLLESWRAGG